MIFPFDRIQFHLYFCLRSALRRNRLGFPLRIVERWRGAIADPINQLEKLCSLNNFLAQSILYGKGGFTGR